MRPLQDGDAGNPLAFILTGLGPYYSPMAEREGFEPSHRKTQPNGLANRPLIASWVPLQI